MSSALKNSWVWKTWIKHPAVYPIYAVLGAATGVMLFFSARTFALHNDVYWIKHNRQAWPDVESPKLLGSGSLKSYHKRFNTIPKAVDEE
jgi:hypothetical protein